MASLPGFMQVVQDEWNKPIRGKGFATIIHRLNRVKQKLKGLHTSEHMVVKKHVELCQNRVHDLQQKMIQNPIP